MKSSILAAAICLLFVECNDKRTPEASPTGDVLMVNVDSAMKPSEDFFMYANGGWINANAIPPEESSWGLPNLVLNENLNRLRIINENAVKENSAKGSSSQKLAEFWSTAMDSGKVEQVGTKPLQPYFDKISNITDLHSFLDVAAELNTIGVSALFSDAVEQDEKNSEVMSYHIWQGGIGLPDREYYFKTDSSITNIRIQYLKHITQYLSMQSQDSLKASVSALGIMHLETKLAQASKKREDLRDPDSNYTKLAISQVNKMDVIINWKQYLQVLGIKDIDSVIVGQPKFLAALDTVLRTTAIDDWKNYLRFRLISTYSGALPDAYGLEAFNFSRLLSGAKERKPRWKRVIQAEEGAMGELLGQLYVKEYFNETAKKRYSDMVEAVRDAYKQRIMKLNWMSDSTKQKALIKLAAIKKKVGFPDKWKDFSAMEIGKDSYLQNMINVNKWWHNYHINKLGKPVNRDEWNMTPQTWNAYYDPSNNEIVLPAAAFTVPGFKDEQLDDATVYGYAAASTIGHEMTHGFDDQGRKFDERGNLKPWWTKNDEAEFNKRAELMIRQFGEFEPLPGLHINAKNSLGENIADLGGIVIALDAFKKTQTFKRNEMIAGLTPLQRFFMGYALSWLGYMRDESLKNRLMTDEHAPAKYRVNGPFVNVDDFYSTFGIKPGDKMYRPDSLRVKIW